MKAKVLLALLLVLGIALAGGFFLNHRSAPLAPVIVRPATPVAPAKVPDLLPAELVAAAPAEPERVESPAPRLKSPPSAANAPVSEPLARAALGWVGVDRDAEAVWVQAINDPRLSAKTRQDLIEDLNEEGFPDPKHPTTEDLPLIVSRLELIEQLAPSAMDEVNDAAFQEAYKDLATMYARLTGP
jgi:hypothetical protein